MADMNYVSPLTSDLTDYYTKSEVDELQQGDAATYATSAEIVAGDNAVKGWVASQGYLTEHQDLTNYATKDYVAAAVEDIETGGVSIEVVDTLPAHPEENVIYLTRKSDSDTDNIYNEWIWVADTESYELIGDTSSGVIPDLSDYATKQWVEAKGYLDSSALTGYATVSDLADFATKDYVDDELANKANTADLAAVATSGDYEDLSNKPTIPSLTGYATEAYVNNAVEAIDIPDVSNFIDAEQAESIAADEVATKMDSFAAELATVATSGDYNDLSNKPTIPAAPDLTPYATKQELTAKADAASLASVATSGDYDDLTNKPTIPVLPTLATVATSGSYNDLSDKPVIPSEGLSQILGDNFFKLFAFQSGQNIQTTAYLEVSNSSQVSDAIKKGLIFVPTATQIAINYSDFTTKSFVEIYNYYNGDFDSRVVNSPNVWSGMAYVRVGDNTLLGWNIDTTKTNKVEKLRTSILKAFTKYQPYINTTSGLTATTVQGAIDELAAASGSGSEVGWSYDSSTGYMTFTGMSDNNM